MNWLETEAFVCLDCETTGLDPQNDRIIEVAVAQFNSTEIIRQYESLIDPCCQIPASSIAIHHITQQMVAGKPTIVNELPEIFELIGNRIIIGHGINFDLDILGAEAKRVGVACNFRNNRVIDTLRLARHYGDSPSNGLAKLGVHFNIPSDGAHRAMSDVMVNIEVFKHLARLFKSAKQLFEMLEKPILLRAMPLGKHKGRLMRDIPLQYLQWAAGKDFDQDLLFSLRSEIKRRKKGNAFEQTNNPFMEL